MANKVDVGLGTKIANTLTKIGLKPCSSCSKRVDKINKYEAKVKNVFFK